MKLTEMLGIHQNRTETYSVAFITGDGVDADTVTRNLDLDDAIAGVKKLIPRLFPTEMYVDPGEDDPFSDTESEPRGKAYIFVIAGNDTTSGTYFHILENGGKLYYSIAHKDLLASYDDMRSIRKAADGVESRLADMGIECETSDIGEAVEIPKTPESTYKCELVFWPSDNYRPQMANFDDLDAAVKQISEWLPSQSGELADDPFSDVEDESSGGGIMIDINIWETCKEYGWDHCRSAKLLVRVHDGKPYLYDLQKPFAYTRPLPRMIAKRLAKFGIQPRLGDSENFENIEIEGVEPKTGDIEYYVVFGPPVDRLMDFTTPDMAQAIAKVGEWLPRLYDTPGSDSPEISDDPFSDTEDEPDDYTNINIQIVRYGRVTKSMKWRDLGGGFSITGHPKLRAYDMYFAGDKETKPRNKAWVRPIIDELVDHLETQFGIECSEHY